MEVKPIEMGSFGWWLFIRSLSVVAVMVVVAGLLIPGGALFSLAAALTLLISFDLAHGDASDEELRFRRFLRVYRVPWQDVVSVAQLARPILRLRLRKHVGYSRGVDIVLDPSETEGRWTFRSVQEHVERARPHQPL